MKIDEKTIKHVADIAKIKLTDEEIKKFESEFKKILEFFSEIQGIKKGSRVLYGTEKVNPLREDRKVKRFENVDKILGEVPEKEGKYVKVPKSLK